MRSVVSSSRRLVSAFSAALVVVLSGPAWAGGVSEHGGAAAVAAAQSVGHSVQAVSKLAAGVLGVVLEVPAAVGQLSGESAEALWEHANRPLPVDEAVYTVGPPPNRALRP
jgi:hypothetical protein